MTVFSNHFNSTDPIEDAGDLIVNFAPTGLIPTKEMTPFVPIEPDEIIGDIHLKNVDHLVKTYYLIDEGFPVPTSAKNKELGETLDKRRQKKVLNSVIALVLIIVKKNGNEEKGRERTPLILIKIQ